MKAWACEQCGAKPIALVTVVVRVLDSEDTLRVCRACLQKWRKR